MLMIRFQRTGRRNIPTYRLVAADKRAAAKGKVVEYLGYYLPARNPPVFEFQRDRIEHWVKHGASLSDSAARLLTRAGVPNLERFILPYTKKRAKGEQAAEPAAKSPSAASSAPESSKSEASAKTDDKTPRTE
jgi:small subunit ribosomal protein S16